MKVRVPLMVQDPAETADVKEAMERVDISGEGFFLDGPVTRRVAVLDLDARTGKLVPGARFLPPKGKIGEYEVPDPRNLEDPALIQVSTFAAVIKTMYLFEDEETLGRPLRWAFDAPQLLVVPRAGEGKNAYYERESQSLQFFSFPDPRDSGRTIYTCHSRDIVCHETAHAILDGILPDLYHALTPQSLALHEAMADLTAVLMAFSSAKLRLRVLEGTGGRIDTPNAFSAFAEQFGSVRDPERQQAYERSLLNQRTLDPTDPNHAIISQPHSLSEVLSGALYQVMIKIHERLKQEPSVRKGSTEAQIPFRALARGARLLKRIIFRGLDYLPPGEVSFIDYGRAMIAADQAAHPLDARVREWICEEFKRRHIVSDVGDLAVKTNYKHPALKDVDLQSLVESDWAAYEFANRNRKLLRIPANVRHFRVRPRLDVSKLYSYSSTDQRKIRECLFKVSWDHEEENAVGDSLPPKRQLTLGTTLAIDWETRMVRAVLTTHSHTVGQLVERDQMLLRLMALGVLEQGGRPLVGAGQAVHSDVRAEAMNDLMRVRGTARTLHITGGA